MRSGYLATMLTITLALGASAGCATKGYVVETVEDRVTTVEERVSTVEGDLADATAATERNASRIGEVDQTANTALSTATDAGESAHTAQQTADDALSFAEHLEGVQRQLLFEVVIAEDVDQFGFGDATLPDTATDALDALVERLGDAPTAVHLEIQGHTDDSGPTAFNEHLGLQRAEAVKRYLYEIHRVPLHKMNVISFGETHPVVPNTDRESRAKNRRVVVQVLGSDVPRTIRAGSANEGGTVASEDQ